MYFVLRYYKEETQLVELFFTKGVLEELVVKVGLSPYSKKKFNKFASLKAL